MKYPALTRSDCRQLAGQRLKGHDPSVDSLTRWLGAGDDLEMADIHQTADLFEQKMTAHAEVKDRDWLEGHLAGILYQALHPIPVSILDDPRFWRYLSLRYFWNFIEWREAGAFGRGNHMKYIDGENSAECVLTRMYLRVQALGGMEYAHLAEVLPKSTDFWRSHVLRTRTATAPAVTRALVKMQRDRRLSTPDIRALAKALNRTWTNVVLNLYSEEEAQKLIEELRSDVIETAE